VLTLYVKNKIGYRNQCFSLEVFPVLDNLTTSVEQLDFFKIKSEELKGRLYVG